MQLSQIDLNLFLVFDAIYQEGGITAASRRLCLSQPAVSHALARLRELLGDPLFERRGNAMMPTALARSLVAPVRQALGGLEQTMRRIGQFEPATTQRRFTVAMREAHEASLLPPLVERLRRETEHVDLASVRIERSSLVEALKAGELDLAIDVDLALSPEVQRTPLRADGLVVLARADHPRIRGTLDLETYLALDHVLVTGRRRGGGYEDALLARLGLTRHVRIRCQQHAAASAIVARSDLVVTMSRSQATLAQREGQQLLPFPVECPPIGLFLYWHTTVADDPANQWLRTLVATVFAAHA